MREVLRYIVFKILDRTAPIKNLKFKFIYISKSNFTNRKLKKKIHFFFFWVWWKERKNCQRSKNFYFRLCGDGFQILFLLKYISILSYIASLSKDPTTESFEIFDTKGTFVAMDSGLYWMVATIPTYQSSFQDGGTVEDGILHGKSSYWHWETNDV